MWQTSKYHKNAGNMHMTIYVELAIDHFGIGLT